MLQFTQAARALSRAASSRGLVAPGFRSPPRDARFDRAVRRRGGHVTVAVRVRGRPWPAVLADMIEGVVVANGLRAVEAEAVRRELWRAVEDTPPARAA